MQEKEEEKRRKKAELKKKKREEQIRLMEEEAAREATSRNLSEKFMVMNQHKLFQNCRKEAEGQGAIDGAAAEGADIVDGIKDMMFGSDEDAAAAGGVGEVNFG